VGMIGSFAGLSWATGRNRRDGTLAAAAATDSLDADGPNGHQEQQA